SATASHSPSTARGSPSAARTTSPIRPGDTPASDSPALSPIAPQPVTCPATTSIGGLPVRGRPCRSAPSQTASASAAEHFPIGPPSIPNRDDDFSASVSPFDIGEGRRGLAQRVGLVDDRSELPGLDELLQHDQVSVIRHRKIPAQTLAHERRQHEWLDEANQHAEPMRPRPAIEYERLGGRERASAVRQGAVLHVVENEIVPLPTPSEILPGVVDDMICAEGADHSRILRAAHA